MAEITIGTRLEKKLLVDNEVAINFLGMEGARVLAAVDGLLARARFARAFDCVAPSIVSENFGQERVRLKGARHPLLEKRLRETGGEIVPLDLELTSDERQLIISGPNAGGKTVALKTTALLAMMAQAGLPAPARAAEFPVFTAFLADIGDAQSIEAALSTFDASTLLMSLGDAIVTGPTEHNLRDLRLLMADYS